MSSSFQEALRGAGLTTRMPHFRDGSGKCGFPGCLEALGKWMAPGEYCITHSRLNQEMKRQVLQGERSRVDKILDAERVLLKG